MPCEFVQCILDLFATTSTSTIATTTLTLASSSQPPQNPSLSLSDAFTASTVVSETAVDDVRLLPNIVGTTSTPAAGMPGASTSRCSLFMNCDSAVLKMITGIPRVNWQRKSISSI